MMKPQQLLLPSLFLMLLGVGNISVGIYKRAQYEAVVSELAQTSSMPEELRAASPLMRIQISKFSTNRLYQHQQRALNRRDFYRLVELGGKLFLVLSVALLVAGLILRAVGQRSAGASS